MLVPALDLPCAAQLGAGVRAVQVRENPNYREWSTCLFLLRADGSEDDMSARKCIARLFPAWGAALSNKFSKARTLQRLCAAHGNILNICAPCTPIAIFEGRPAAADHTAVTSGQSAGTWCMPVARQKFTNLQRERCCIQAANGVAGRLRLARPRARRALAGPELRPRQHARGSRWGPWRPRGPARPRLLPARRVWWAGGPRARAGGPRAGGSPRAGGPSRARG